MATPRLLAACVATNQLPAAQQVLQLARRGKSKHHRTCVTLLEDAARAAYFERDARERAAGGGSVRAAAGRAR